MNGSPEILVAGGVAFEVLAVPPGEFRMGSENQLFSEAPPHVVTFGAGYLLGRAPVTQRQWTAIMGDNPSHFRISPDHPVDSISWDLANQFCHQLGQQLGRWVRLPSEAEWEYACRAGVRHEFFFSDCGPFSDDTAVPVEVREQLCEYAWFDLNSNGRTHPTALKRPNPWGFHDLLGSVWEWCADVWHGSYQAAPVNGEPWVASADRQPRRCLRGGAWDMNAFRCRSCYRSHDFLDLGTSRFGVRIAISSADAGPPHSACPAAKLA